MALRAPRPSASVSQVEFVTNIKVCVTNMSLCVTNMNFLEGTGFIEITNMNFCVTNKHFEFVTNIRLCD